MIYDSFGDFLRLFFSRKLPDQRQCKINGCAQPPAGGDIAVGSKTLKFTIVKAKNPITVKAVTKSAKHKTVRKKNVTVKGAVKVTKAQGKLSYKISSAPKAIKKYLKISSKGVITIKKWKKAKKATYKIKITATAKGTANYNKKSVTKTVTLKIK